MVTNPNSLNLVDNAGPNARSSDARILQAATDVYNENPVLPLPLSAVADRAGVSRALIYSHFPDQYHLLGALIEQQVQRIRAPVQEILGRPVEFAETAHALAERLYDHFVSEGLLIANATQDDFLSGHLPASFHAFLSYGLRQLARQASAEFGLARRPAIAAMLLLAVIPEQAARLVRTGQLSEPAGRRGVRRAIRISVETFRAG